MFPTQAAIASNYRRLQRFFEQVILDEGGGLDRTPAEPGPEPDYLPDGPSNPMPHYWPAEPETTSVWRVFVLSAVAIVAGSEHTGVRAQAPAPTEPTPDSSTPLDPRQDPRSTGSTPSGESLSERLVYRRA